MPRCGVLVLVVLLLGGCGGEELGDKPDLPDETPALWNPCDVLDPGFVERQFGSVAEEETGTEAAPECRFRPAEKSGQAVVTSSYTLFTGTLDDAWESMGQPPDAEVTEPEVDGADAARIVVDVVRRQLYVTGFVENGDLIQNVNVVDPAPYDEQRVVAGVRSTLALLSRHALESGVGEEDG